jgi:hypothetical protein
MKYLERKSDSSEEENFQVVTSRKTKKTKRRIQTQKKNNQGGMTILLMSPYPLEEGYLDRALSTTSGRSLLGSKFLNDRSTLEL